MVLNIRKYSNSYQMTFLIPINKDTNIEVILDTNGNVYMHHNDVTYDISITNTNTLTLDKIHDIDMMETGNSEIKKGGLKLVNKENTLKSRIVREKQKEKSENPEETELEDIDEDEKDIKYNDQYYENNTYIEEYDDDSDEETDKVYFLGKGIDNIKILKYEDSNVPLYDTLIYNNDINTGEPIIKTKFTNTEPVYRLKIYKSGHILFRPIGNKEQTYIIRLNDNILALDK